jgi:hypothetical protein
MREERVRTLTVAIAAFGCAAALAYAASRAIQVVAFTDPDPRQLVKVTRIAFFWRAWVALYAGVLAAIGAAALRSRSPAAVDAALPSVVVATALLCTAQGLFLP